MPLLLAITAFHKRWQQAFLIMMATMLVDLDHLLAYPIYDPNRCSIGIHPLHQPLLFVVYAGFLIFPQTRLVGIGLAIHMLLDGVDCLSM